LRWPRFRRTDAGKFPFVLARPDLAKDTRGHAAAPLNDILAKLADGWPHGGGRGPEGEREKKSMAEPHLPTWCPVGGSSESIELSQPARQALDCDSVIFVIRERGRRPFPSYVHSASSQELKLEFELDIGVRSAAGTKLPAGARWKPDLTPHQGPRLETLSCVQIIVGQTLHGRNRICPAQHAGIILGPETTRNGGDHPTPGSTFKVPSTEPDAGIPAAPTKLHSQCWLGVSERRQLTKN